MATTSENDRVDLSVFDDTRNGECEDQDFRACLSMQRLLVALKYYSTLNILDSEDDLRRFQHFVFKVYTNNNFVDDYVHLSMKHEHQLEEIQTHFVQQHMQNECDLSKCVYTARHQLLANQANTKLALQLDSRLRHFQTMFDELHFYVLHLFEVGLRLTNKEKAGSHVEADDDAKNDDNAKPAHFDADFARTNRVLSARHDLASSFERFSPGNDGRYDLMVAGNEKANGNDDATYLDNLYRNLKAKGVENESILKLQQVIKDHEYDTESLDTDFEDDMKSANIQLYTDDEECSKVIQNELQLSRASSSSFAVGFRFYYWPKFKTLDDLPAEYESRFNQNDHGGYKVRELYVEKKYGSFKEEIASYRAEKWNLQIYNERVRVKAISFLSSKIVKETKARLRHDYRGLELYGIAKGAVLGYPNLVCLTLYCDYSELSAVFTGSFRKKHPFETLSAVKRRNSSFWWWSKILRETVEAFGQSYPDLKGPFYCGMSMVMTMPQFQIRLNGPVSTTKYDAVALQFSKAHGMLIQLDNCSGIAEYVRGFNCSWISRYRAEDERLFFGGYYPINVQGVKLMKTKQNFEDVLLEMCELDKMLNGGYSEQEEFVTLLPLLSGASAPEIDAYVAGTFGRYRKAKTMLNLNLHELAERVLHKGVLVWMMHTLIKTSFEEEKAATVSGIVRSDLDKCNLPRRQLFDTFPNCKELVISTTDEYGGCNKYGAMYSFSLLSFLEVVKSSELVKIVIKANIPDLSEQEQYGDKCWLDIFWMDKEKKRSVEEAYQAQGYSIKLEPKLVEDAEAGLFERWCIIRKQ